MMSSKRVMKTVVAGVALVTVSATSAFAQGTADRRLSFSFDLGTETAVSGDLHGGAQGTVLALPTTVESRSYGDIYGASFSWAASLGYRVGTNGEVRGRFHYAADSAESLQVGNVATLPLFAAFDDYKAWGVDFGYRQYFAAADATVRPYGGASVGFAQVEAINATLTVPAASVTLSDVPFYDDSTLPTFAFSAGVVFGLSDSVALQGGIDFRWQGDLKEIEGLAGTGLQTINDESRRWTLPIQFGLTIRF